MAAKFEIYEDNGGEFRFRLKAGNGEKILASEGYKDKSGAENGVASVKKNALEDGRYERKTSSNGKHYFNLKAANHQVIGTSEMYDLASGMENGVESVKRNAPEAEIVDLTA